MQGDLARLRNATSRLFAVEHADALPEQLLDCIGELVPGEIISYNEVPPPGAGAVRVLARPEPEAEEDDLMAAFADHVGENPLLAHHLRTGESRALRFSDVIGRRELRRLPLYQLCYRQRGIEHQLAISIPTRTHVIGLTVSRARSDFSERDRELLDLLAMPARAVHERLAERDLQRAALRALESSGPGLGVVVLGPRGTVVDASPLALELIGGELTAANARLLSDWAAALSRRGPQPPPGWLRLGGRRLRAQLLRGTADEPDLLTLQAPSPPPSPESLRALGLSPRQAEVLALIASGLTNRQIAAALTISPHTVDHHVEAVLTRLEVRSRTAAARIALNL